MCIHPGTSAYTINSSTGALRAVAGSPFATGSSPFSAAVDPSGQFAYVANDADNTVSAYAVVNSSAGALRAVSGSPFAAGLAPALVAIAGQAVTTSHAHPALARLWQPSDPHLECRPVGDRDEHQRQSRGHHLHRAEGYGSRAVRFYR